MPQSRWVSLERYNIRAGFKVLGDSLFPVVIGPADALARASHALVTLGFRQMRDGAYAMGWATLPTMEAWADAFPAAIFAPLESMAEQAAMGLEAKHQMVERGLVSRDAFGDAQLLDAGDGTPPGVSQPKVAGQVVAQEWPWLDMAAYGLEVVVRRTDSGTDIRVEGPKAAKHLVSEALALSGAAVLRDEADDLTITIPRAPGAFDMRGLIAKLPMAKIKTLPAEEVPVREVGDEELARLDLSGRLDRQTFQHTVRRRYNAGAVRFTISDLEEIGAGCAGVSPSLMRAEFGITPRALQEQLESSLAAIFGEDSQAYSDADTLIDFGKSLDDLLPREQAFTGNSKKLQQFSTPLSISAAIQSIVGITHETPVWEPTAGNASLVTLADPGMVHGLELDAERIKNLHAKGYVAVRHGDAVSGNLGTGQYPRVVMNPPFGAFGDGQGGRVFKTDVPGPNGGTSPFIRLTSQDKYIALRHMNKLAADGVAALILGADHPMNYKPGEYSEETKQFLHFLGDTHHILDIKYVEGKMYGSHGAGWPLLVIVTGDKRAELGNYMPPDKLSILSNVDDLKTYVADVTAKVKKYLEERNVDASIEREKGNNGLGGNEKQDSGQGNIEGRTSNFSKGGEEPAETANVVEATYDNEITDATEAFESLDEESNDAKSRHAANIDEKEILYSPRSQMKALGKRVPANLAPPITNALDRVERAKGDIDLYVARELGWSMDQLGNALAAEQVDAVALALYQAQLGKGFILGDYTGIGKGRVVAALATWGIRNGHRPIFCTSKSDLFGDIMRDFQDIGEADLVKPFVLNDIAKDIVRADSGEVIVKKTPRDVVAKAIKGHVIPDGYNAVFMTYSQVNKIMSRSKKAQWLARVAEGNVLLFDEVHNASGPESNTGANVRDAVRVAKFTLGSSATYAKRPDNLGLYEFTSMFDGNDPESVIESVTRGGPEYQEVLSTMLAESGQLIARTHEPPPPPKAILVNPTYKEGFDSLEFSDRLAQVLDAMTAVAEQSERIVNQENEEIRLLLEKMPKEQRKGMSYWRSQCVHFASQMHNIVRVANYAAKADAIVDEVDSAIKQGRRPLVAVEGTMEAFLLGAYRDALQKREDERLSEATRRGVDITEIPYDTSPILANLTYRDTIKSFLDKMIVIKRTDRYGNESSEGLFEPEAYMAAFRRDQDGSLDNGPGLEEQLKSDIDNGLIEEDQAYAVRFYFSVVEKVERLPDSLPASPIDYVRCRLAERGIKTGELTGRNLGMQYHPNGEAPEFYVRSNEDKDRRRLADEFNNGDVQCLIFNSAAAEGVSLHAHQDFKNNEDRTTIFWQVPGDINVYTQMSGRTHRSGAREGAMPDFRVICLDTPIEDRMMANLEMKEGSLKANVKADRETGIAMRSEPMMNRVGDLVTWEVLNRHPQKESICKRLSIDLDSELEKFSQSSVKEKTGTETGLFSKVTGRLCRMVLAESRPLLELMEEAFRERVEYLDRHGMNPLKTRIHDLRATLVEKRELFPRSGPSAFESEVLAQKVTYIDYIKPITLEAVEKQIATSMESMEKRGFGRYPLADMWSFIEGEQTTRLLSELQHNAIEFYEKLPGNVHDKLEQARNIIRAQWYRLPPNEELVERFKNLVFRQDTMKKLRDLLGIGVEVKGVPVGKVLLDCDVEKADMIVSRILPPPPGANPSLPGRWTIRLESPNAEVGRFDLSLNQLLHLLKENPEVKFDPEPLEKNDIKARFHSDRHPQSLLRERWIIMGNLPKAYTITANNPSAGRGSPGVFTTEDGSKLRGIIMPRDFDARDLRRLMDSHFTMSTFEAVSAYVERRESIERHPCIYTSAAWQMNVWALKERKEFHPGRGALLIKDSETLEWKLRISAVKKNNVGYLQDGNLLNLLDGDFATAKGMSKMLEAPVPRGNVDDVLQRLMMVHNQAFHGDGSDADWYRSFMRERGRRLIQEAEEKSAAERPHTGQTVQIDRLPEPGFSLEG